LWQLKTS